MSWNDVLAGFYWRFVTGQIELSLCWLCYSKSHLFAIPIRRVRTEYSSRPRRVMVVVWNGRRRLLLQRPLFLALLLGTHVLDW